jgi:CRP/FNR family transcriptional regulator, polysaccharide utilization system transcription regulator
MGIEKPNLSVVAIGEPSLPCQGHIKKLLECKTTRAVPPQHVIFSQGETPHTVFFICKGLVKLTRTESDGSRAIVGLRGTGWLLGAAPLLGEHYASTAEAVMRSTLCIVPRDKFRQEMETNAQFSQWVAMIFSRQVYSSVFSISERSCLSGRKRLEKFLCEIVQRKNDWNSNKVMKIPILLKQWEVAQLLGLSPEHLCRLIKQMENEGIISRENGWLILRNMKKLSLSGSGSRDLSQSK